MSDSLKALFSKYQAATSPYPIGLEVDHAEGLYIYDKGGKRYLDLVAGIGVSNIGHRHPLVVEAIKKQVDRYLHVMVYGEFVQEPQALLAQKLTSLLPENLNAVYLVNSGAEATETALKLAKRTTGRSQLISCRGAYHGSTHGALSVTGNETKKAAFRPLLPNVHWIGFNEIPDLEKITEATAGVIVETVQGDAGVIVPEVKWLKALRERCSQTGTQLILDEVQCGIGRCGSMFAFEQFGIVPDILLLGKALGGGMPIGAMVSSREKMEQLSFDPVLGHITTFGGHPVVAAAALATLNAIEKESILDGVHEKGAHFARQLKHPQILEVRQIGLMLAVELGSTEAVDQLFHHCLENGLIGFWFLSRPNSFRIAPPLTIGQEEIDAAVQVILKGLDKIQ